jgi:tyrosine-protein kinase Etk/Wzc
MENLQNKIANPTPNIFSINKLLGRAIDYWYLYVISLAICVFIAWFKVHYATPMYKVYAKVLVQDNSNSNNPLSGSANGMDLSSLFGNKTNIQNEIGILQTTDLCRQVVEKMKLYINYYHKGSVRQVELYNGSPFYVDYTPDDGIVHPVSMELNFPSRNSNDFVITVGKKQIPWHFNLPLHLMHSTFLFKNRGKDFDPNASYLLTIQDPQGVATGLAANLDAELMVLKSTILNITYNTNLPQKGVDVLNGIIRAYIDRNLNQKNLTSDSTIEFINSRIALVGSELGNIESTIQQFKQSNKIADIEIQSKELITNSSSFYKQLNELEVQLQVIKTMLEYVEDEQNNRRPVPALLNSDPTFTELVTNYNATQVQRDKLLLSVKVGNPIVNNLDVQISGMRGDIIRSLESQQEALTISRQKLNAQNTELNSRIYNVPQQERQFLDYSREQSVKQALYLFLLQKREEIAIAKAANTSNASVIETPKANYLPYSPSTTSGITIGILLGVLLPTGFIILKSMLNNKILSKEDITEATPATILAEINHSPRSGILNMHEEGRSIIAEQFRIFRTNMEFALAGVQSPVILVTSGTSGEGKSFIASNLGQIYAISGKKVLLMELDLRKPKLSKMLGINSNAGFSNYIVDNRPIQHFIKPVNTTIPSLYLLPAGPVPPNPAELLMSSKMESLMTELKLQYDIIIIDTAPIGAVTDAQVLGKYADVSLYILRQGFSIKNSLQVVNDVFLNSKLPSLYLVVNDVQEGASYKYGYGYGYKYGYGYGYTDNVRKDKKRWRKEA